MHKIFWLENPKGRDHMEDLGVDVSGTGVASLNHAGNKPLGRMEHETG